MFVLDWKKIYQRRLYADRRSCLLIICLGDNGGNLASRFPETLEARSRNVRFGQNWREPLRGQASGNGLANYRVAAALVLSVFVLFVPDF